MPRKHILTPAEALAAIKALDEADAKALLCVLVGAWANNPEAWKAIVSALGKPADHIASAK